MNLLQTYILHFYLLFSTSGVAKKRRELKTNFTIFDDDNVISSILTSTTNITTTTTTTTEPIIDTTRKIGEKEIKYVLMKMLLIASNKNICKCNCTKNVEISTTDKNKLDSGSTNLLGKRVVMKNKPEKYSGVRNDLSRLCPYFVPNEGFRMNRMADVFWPKFYNMKESLNCFKINVLRLTDMQRKRNELTYGHFGGKVDWTRCHFEIKPPDSVAEMRHFLMGDVNDRGVMRNILVTAKENGEFSLQEETPDQWLMVRNLVLLRDCETGEVVVFTRSPQMTTTGDIVLALQDLGEEMIGKMLCDEDDDWLHDGS